jgi:hypothetical protein
MRDRAVGGIDSACCEPPLGRLHVMVSSRRPTTCKCMGLVHTPVQVKPGCHSTHWRPGGPSHDDAGSCWCRCSQPANHGDRVQGDVVGAGPLIVASTGVVQLLPYRDVCQLRVRPTAWPPGRSQSVAVWVRGNARAGFRWGAGAGRAHRPAHHNRNCRLVPFKTVEMCKNRRRKEINSRRMPAQRHLAYI